MADLNLVYAAPDESAAMGYLEEFADKWDTKYHNFLSPGKNIGLIYLRISSIQRLFAELSIPLIRLKASIAS